MAMFDVYVEGATDPSPQATQRLAEVMAQRYGLPAADLVTRLSKGRFRVKASVDEATAQTYVRDLEAVGARVTLVEARGQTLPPPRPGLSQPPPSEPKRPKKDSKGAYSITRPSNSSIPPSAAARKASASLPPASAARPATPSLPPAGRPPPSSSLPPRPPGASTPPSGTPYASGLSAAFHENTPVPELGALDKDAFSVESLDGQDELRLETSPSGPLPASIGPATTPAAPRAERPKDVPMDLFAPPDAQSEDFKVELAADEVAHRERKKLATPANAVPVVVGQAPSSPVLRPKGPAIPPTERSSGVRLQSVGDDEAPRWRFAAGVLAAVLIGFLPANCVQGMREESAFHDIDTHVATIQAQAATSASAPIPFSQLDAFRDEQIARKKSERRNLAIVSMLIWALAGAGIGYVWFRRVPWDKIKLGQS